MVLIPKGKNTESFRNAVGIFETDLNLVSESLEERLVAEGWTEDEVKFLIAQLLRGIEVKTQNGTQVELGGGT